MRGAFDPAEQWPPEVGHTNTIIGDSLFFKGRKNDDKCSGAIGGQGIFSIDAVRLD